MDDDIRANYKQSSCWNNYAYEHSGLTDSGKPRFARYIRKRDDVVIKDKSESVEKSVEKRDNVIRIFGKLYEYEKKCKW